ncbi:MAG: acyltransferase family protein [Marmoricola sp.]
MRQEIQGLRAVAVLLVVLFHLWPHRIPGGYIGVDVFFVVSGFLITSLLVREVDRTGTVSLTNFWARRIRRLLPAAYVVLIASAIGVVTLVPRTLWQQFLGEILGAGLYVENWVLALSSVDYLSADGAPSPAQHYWTLSAEEQFYLVWPLLVLTGIWLARRRRTPKAGVFAVLSVGVLASLAYSLWVTATNPAWAYFVTTARAWEFGAGALLAFAPAAARYLPRVARALLGWVALVALLAAAFVLDESTPMPGTAAIWVVLASALLIWVEAPALGWSSDRLLVARPARAMGDISYAVYLWHWPLIILLPYATDHPLTTLDKVSILMATIGLSALTKRFVEDPVRAARRFGLARSRVTFGYAVVGALLLTAICLVPRNDVARDVERTQQVAAELAAQPPECFGAAARDPKAEGCPNDELANTIVPAPEAAGEDFPRDARCADALAADPIEPCRYGHPRDGVPHVAVVGDSHARVLMTTVERLVEEGKVTADQFVASACPWSTKPPASKSPFGPGCSEFRSKFYPYLEDHATEYDAILTTARLTTLSGTQEELVEGMSEAWQQVTRKDVPVVVVRDNPTAKDGDGNPQACLSTVPVSQANEECSLDRGERLDGWFDALSAAASRTPGAEVVDLTPFYCDEDTCPVVVGGVNVYRDNNHLTVTYARTLAPYLFRAIKATGALRG